MKKYEKPELVILNFKLESKAICAGDRRSTPDQGVPGSGVTGGDSVLVPTDKNTSSIFRENF